MISTQNQTLSLKVLVADDNNYGRLMIKECLERSGHQAILAEDGIQAVALFESESPDVVLLDVVMPNMDGFEAAKKIRQTPNGELCPLLFLSALDDKASQLQGLTYGDGYIEKPIQFDMLLARLNSFFRQIIVNRQLAKQKTAAEQALHQLEEENEMGAYVLSRILTSARSPDELIKYIVMPAARFSGDLVLYEKSPENNIYVMLADAVGHGISAALNVFPLFQIFMGMAKKNLSLLEIVKEMNHTLKAIMPIDRFVSACLLHIDPSSRHVTLWNGGCPPVLVIDSHGKICQRYEPRCLPLRLVDDAMIESNIDDFTLNKDEELILFSDGLAEIGRHSVSEGITTIQATLLNSQPGERFDCLVNYLNNPGENIYPHDDASIIVVHGAAI